MKHLSSKIPKACSKCGSELKSKEATFFDYASSTECVKWIINGYNKTEDKRLCIELRLYWTSLH